MRSWLRRWFRVLKLLLGLAILVAIGRQFARDLRIPERGLGPSLEDLWNRLEHPGWLWLTGALYLLGLGFSAVYWYRLMRALGQRPPFLAAIRAHYIGQMGKYLPGKAWALFLRSGVLRGPRVRVSVAILTSFYEVFATMAGGAILAAVLLAAETASWFHGLTEQTFRRLLPRAELDGQPIDPRALIVLALALLAPIGTVLLPPVFNWLVQRIALPFRETDAAPLPAVRKRSTIQGLMMTLGCWLLMGASVWALFQAVLSQPPAWNLDTWGRYTAYTALAYVAGFIILIVPSGLGVREYLLMLCFVPEVCRLTEAPIEDARASTAFAVILLRLVWTASEVGAVALLYWLPVSAAAGEQTQSGLATERNVDSAIQDGRPLRAADRESRI
jgi:uncharacterized membrane protein YbhN (UPF0104 family)